MFCENGTQTFYANTFAGYYSDGLEFFIDGDHRATVSIQIDKIVTTFRAQSDEAKLSLSTEEVQLDTVIMTETEIFAYVSGTGSDVEWQAADDGIVSLVPSGHGVTLTAVQSGQTVVTAILRDAEGNMLDQKQVVIEVAQGNSEISNLRFVSDGIRAGEWHSSADGIVGSRSGDGFILAEEELENHTLEATINVANAEAAALVFRSDAQMDFYYVANYDKNQGIVKVWSPEKEFLNVSVGTFDEVTLRIGAEGNTFSYYFNGDLVGTFTDENAPQAGYVGLNVFNGTAVFKSVKGFSLRNEDIIYSGADVTFYLSTDSYVSGLFNFTLANTPVAPDFYTQNGNEQLVSARYLSLVGSEMCIRDRYAFIAMTESGTDRISVTVEHTALLISDVVLSELANVHVNVGSAQLTGVELNGVALSDTSYTIGNGVLTIYSAVLTGGLNTCLLYTSDAADE